MGKKFFRSKFYFLVQMQSRCGPKCGPEVVQMWSMGLIGTELGNNFILNIITLESACWDENALLGQILADRLEGWLVAG